MNENHRKLIPKREHSFYFGKFGQDCASLTTANSLMYKRSDCKADTPQNSGSYRAGVWFRSRFPTSMTRFGASELPELSRIQRDSYGELKTNQDDINAAFIDAVIN
jgi:hypothetical protein